jgi:hypothetical protein
VPNRVSIFELTSMLFFIQKADVCPLWGPYEIGRIAARPMLNIGPIILAQMPAKYLIQIHLPRNRAIRHSSRYQANDCPAWR